MKDEIEDSKHGFRYEEKNTRIREVACGFTIFGAAIIQKRIISNDHFFGLALKCEPQAIH